MEPSNAALVQACHRGDAHAWELLVGRYQRLLYSIPRRAGLNQDAAAEVVQHTFAMLVEKLDQIEHPERIGAWLVTTARRETWRVRHRERMLQPIVVSAEDDEELLIVPDNAALPDELLMRMETQHAIRTAVAALDERCRTLLTLLFYRPAPPSYADIAAELGMNEGSLGPTRARCFQKLRRLLNDVEL